MLRIFLAVLAAALLGACSHDRRIRVGSKNFTEQLVLGEIVAQHLENRLHGHVSRKLDLGGTLLADISATLSNADPDAAHVWHRDTTWR